MHLQFKKLFVQQFNDPTMIFKHTEITVPSIAIKATSFLCQKGTDRQCPFSQTWLLCLTAAISINYRPLNPQPLTPIFRSLQLYVWLHVCKDFSRSHIILSLFLLPSSGQFSLAKPTPLFLHRLCQISSSCSLCSCLCVSAGCHYAADHITSMWNQTQGDEL